MNKIFENIRAIKRAAVTFAAVLILAVSWFSGFLQQNEEPIQSSNEGNPTYTDSQEEIKYTFRNDTYLTQHFEKHGGEFDYSTKEEYLAGANHVIASDDALHKTEKEDGDDVYYLESSNEFVIVSTDGYIRTYFKPQNGIAYYNRQ